MSKIAALKKKAADTEKKSPEKAIPVYVELLAEMERTPEELDVALFNRLGDLMVKAGNVGQAVDYSEKAVDHSVEGGFFNNAIALCNKILRSSPGRASVYYKLGKISAHKGFKADAKTNFLEYADRMQKGGNTDEAFRALAEFADLCPDQTDIRLMLADQLAKAGKKDRAIEQLQILHEQLDAEGRADEAEAAAARMKAIDPSVEPRVGGGGGAAPGGGGGGGDDLVFLDLGDSPKAQAARLSIAKKRATIAGMKAVADEPKKTPASSAAQPPAPPPPKPAAPAPAPPPVAAAPEDSGQLLGLESTSLGDSSSLGGGSSLEIEHTSLNITPSVDESAGTLDFVMPDAGPAAAEVPLLDGNLDLGSPAAEPEPEPAPAEDVPLLELNTPAVEEVAVEPLEPLDLGRPSTLMPAPKSIDVLQAVVDGSPEDWGARRELAEAMLEKGNREGGLRELETAMLGYERTNDLSTAMSVADEIVRLDPSSVKHHQKRVEYAYRTNDRAQLVESYLSLADALFRGGQVDKSRTIYQRVLELSPDDVRAQAALGSMPAPEAPPAPPAAAKKGEKPPVPIQSAKPTPIGDDAFVNLGDWLRDEEGEKDTRMIVAEEEPTGNEEADFADMLKKFKQGVAENVEAEDYQSHYDLGVAFKEMGLVDEAIAEFQKALRGPTNRVRTYEAIGQCFIEKGQSAMAATILNRALGEKEQTDDQLIGVLYYLGRANESLGKLEEALAFYQRVFVVDIQFQDVGDRLNALENAPK
jgi:tetratricopeptide (TPR) repeat protein